MYLMTACPVRSDIVEVETGDKGATSVWPITRLIVPTISVF